jgi:hypothetical protein
MPAVEAVIQSNSKADCNVIDARFSGESQNPSSSVLAAPWTRPSPGKTRHMERCT